MEQSDKALSESLPPQAPAKKPFSLPWNFAFIFIGILIGIAGLLAYQGYLPQLTKGLYSAIWILFAFVILSFIVFFGVKSYITKAIFGGKVADSGELLSDAQKIADVLTERVADKILIGLPEIDRDKIKNILPRLANWFFWQKLRNWWWQWIVAIFVSLTGITGTLLLINQNELLGNQNELLNTQNKFIKEQSSLSEGARRSSLVFLMGEIMQAVNEELKDKSTIPYNKERHLSPQLIARIAAFSHSLKPYKYLDGDSLIPRPLSPERGQLLLNIAYLKLDSVKTTSEIFERSTFAEADLRGTVLTGMNLEKANLSYADLSFAKLSFANLMGSNLQGADLREADLTHSNLFKINLKGANLSKADLASANLEEANVREATLKKTNLQKAVLRKASFYLSRLDSANLNNADLSNAKMPESNMQGAWLIKANLTGADFGLTNLDNANLTEADLTEAGFEATNLINANLTRVIFKRTILTGSILIGTNFTGVDLTEVDLNSVLVCSSKCNWFEDIKKFKAIGYEKIIETYEIKIILGYNETYYYLIKK